MQVERVDFVSIASQDIERSRRFYLQALGLRFDRDVPGSRGFECWAGNVCLSVWEPGGMGLPFTPSAGSIALRVPDVAAARAELEANGVEFSGDTLDTGVCHMAFFRDPDGNALMLHRRYAPRAG
jgi:catechol 2,3-dioxygenase-like lactoylglutathione lyase family enzyme